MVPLFKPYMPPNLSIGIEDILRSNQLMFSQHGVKFETILQEYIGQKNLLLVQSYNHAILITLSTLGLEPGDEIIASPMSCLASTQPFLVKNLKVVWADVDPKTGTLSVEDVESKITTRTKAIFHNHFCGYLGEIDRINELGKFHGIIVIDDCIEAFGSEYKTKLTGNLGTEITIFSFETVRLPNTINGGAIVFKDKSLFKKAKLIRDYGIDRMKFRDHLNEIDTDYQVKHEGYGGLMSEVNSFIGFSQMKDVNKLIEHQRNNAVVWDEQIKNTQGIEKIKITSDTVPNYWVYGVLAEDKVKTIAKFRAEGMYASGVHINLNIYSLFGDQNKLRGVTEFASRFVALPCGWWVNPLNILI